LKVGCFFRPRRCGPDHIVVVVESDRFANALGDTANMPYVNQLAAGALVFSKTQGINTSAQGGEMNYLALYSGSSQGITDNGRGYTFAGANLAQSLNSTTGLSFTGFSESLVSDGSQVQQVSDGVHPDLYTRNHNPMAMFTNAGTGKTNADVNKTFTSFKAFANASQHLRESADRLFCDSEQSGQHKRLQRGPALRHRSHCLPPACAKAPTAGCNRIWTAMSSGPKRTTACC